MQTLSHSQQVPAVQHIRKHITTSTAHTVKARSATQVQSRTIALLVEAPDDSYLLLREQPRQVTATAGHGHHEWHAAGADAGSE